MDCMNYMNKNTHQFMNYLIYLDELTEGFNI
jgi:hypothetical protein